MDKKALVNIATCDSIPKKMIQHFAQIAITDAMEANMFEQDFDESKHKRDKSGKFTSMAGQSGGGKSDSASNYKSESGIKPTVKFNSKWGGQTDYPSHETAHTAQQGEHSQTKAKKNTAKNNNGHGKNASQDLQRKINAWKLGSVERQLSHMGPQQTVAYTDAEGKRRKAIKNRVGQWHQVDKNGQPTGVFHNDDYDFSTALRGAKRVSVNAESRRQSKQKTPSSFTREPKWEFVQKKPQLQQYIPFEGQGSVRQRLNRLYNQEHNNYYL